MAGNATFRRYIIIGHYYVSYDKLVLTKLKNYTLFKVNFITECWAVGGQLTNWEFLFHHWKSETKVTHSSVV